MKFLPVVAVSTPVIIMIIIAVVLTGVLIGLTIWGNKQKTKADEAQKQLEDAAMPMSLLVIDKKKMKLSEANLPKVVMDSIPKRMRRSKMPIVKAKAGPKIMSFLCDEKVFELVPVKQEIKAMVSGIYIISIRGIRGAIAPAPKKQGFLDRIFGRGKAAKG